MKSYIQRETGDGERIQIQFQSVSRNFLRPGFIHALEFYKIALYPCHKISPTFFFPPEVALLNFVILKWKILADYSR